MSGGRRRVPDVRQQRLPRDTGLIGAADLPIGRDVSEAQVPAVWDGVPDGTGGDQWLDSGEDAGLDGAAGAIFRADAERLGYVAPDASPADARRGLNAYYRAVGVMPERAYRLISRYEVPMSTYHRGEEIE